MLEVYKALDESARFYETSLAKLEASDIRHGLVDWGGRKYKSTREVSGNRVDAPSLPALPNMKAASYTKTYHEKYADEIKKAGELKTANELLIPRLYRNLSQTERNDYNLKVLLSLADFMRHHMNIFTTLASVENSFQSAVESDQNGDLPMRYPD